MLFKLILVACTLGPALSAYNGPLAGGQPAHQYPAGINPQACPNFPNCDNPALAANPNAPAPQPHYTSQPIYQTGPAFHPGPVYQSPTAYKAAPVYQSGPAFQPSYQQPQQVYQHQQVAAPVYQDVYHQAPQHQQQQHVSPNDPEFTGEYAPKDAVDAGEYVGDGDYRGEGLKESGAFEAAQEAHQRALPSYQGYHQAPVYQPAPVAHSGPAPVPAGVDPNACPNYPYCH